LYSWLDCPPAAWLGLSQLHTVRGVSLTDVPAATIAAALPRLHTLHLHHELHRIDFSVAPFYDELLPRLRSFHLEGPWPNTSDGAELAVVLPLPFLEDLKWCFEGANLPRQLMGARPSTLHLCDATLDDWLQQAADGAGLADALSPHSCVRALTLRLDETEASGALGAASTARLLRAAPQLRKLTFDVCECARVEALWVLSDAVTADTVFAGLFHPRVRHVAITSEKISITGVYPTRYRVEVPVSDGCGVRLRQRHFPRLRRLTANEEEYPV
jgi:hypothetical protein